MRSISESESGDGTTIIKMKIGEVPRLGTPMKDKNGADVYNLPEGVEVLSYSPERGQEFAPVTHLTVEQKCHTVEVTVASRSVIVSDNESLAVFDPITGYMIKVKPLIEEKRMIPYLKKDPQPFGTEYNRDLGWLIGSFLSDGWLSRNCVGYSKLEDIKRDAFEAIAREQLTPNFLRKDYKDAPREGKLGKSAKIHCMGEDLYNAFKKMDLSDEAPEEGRQALTKRITPYILNNSTEECLWGILSGLMDGDGSIAKNTTLDKPRFGCRFSTSSKGLRDSLCKLLYRLGILF